MEIITVPGSQAFLTIIDVLFGHVDPSSDGIGFADPIGPATLWHGFAEGDDAGAA